MISSAMWAQVLRRSLIQLDNAIEEMRGLASRLEHEKVLEVWAEIGGIIKAVLWVTGEMEDAIEEEDEIAEEEQIGAEVDAMLGEGA